MNKMPMVLIQLTWEQAMNQQTQTFMVPLAVKNDPAKRVERFIKIDQL